MGSATVLLFSVILPIRLKHVLKQWHLKTHACSPSNALRLPPAGDTHKHLDWYQSRCLDGRDMTDLDLRALKLYLTRAADVG